MNTTGVISVLVSVAFGAICVIILFVEVPQGSQTIANVVFGVLGTAFITVINFHMGTSRGSQAKDETIKELTKKQENT